MNDFLTLSPNTVTKLHEKRFLSPCQFVKNTRNRPKTEKILKMLLKYSAEYAIIALYFL